MSENDYGDRTDKQIIFHLEQKVEGLKGCIEQLNCDFHKAKRERDFYESLAKDIAMGKAFRFVTDKLEGQPK